ncbi:MAG TPA: amidophosphoribosyltransferase [Gammaproteobacteria bacterium]|nr:amidophosphoribosyltransferase [Gammaproteobacteria bacterium]
MCAIVGIVSRSPVNQELYDALTVLQHRGQDAAGIMTAEDRHFYMRKANGLVRDVFRARHMLRLQGNMGIGHCRYPTAGGAANSDAQPLYTNSPFGIGLAHNGNLTNAKTLSDLIYRADRRHLNTTLDSEVILNVFAHELARCAGLKAKPDDIFRAVASVHERCRGGYAGVAIIVDHGIVAFRDPHGIRPLVLGQRNVDGGPEYMVASESVALDIQGFTYVRDLAPGEVVYIEQDGRLHSRVVTEQSELVPCLFEYVYLARPDSFMDGVSVYKARLRMGEKLAEKILRERPDHDIDVVIPIPETSRTSALPLAQKLGVPFREGFVKNRYVGRTFIMPGQEERRRSVRQKLNVIDLEFKDKTVLLVDDSIVRGTTSRQIVNMARQAGAKRVYLASAAPPVRYPNVYGIDMPVASELIAHERNVEEINAYIGSDWLIYQDLDALVDAVKEGNPRLKRFEDSCFSGTYITGDVTDDYLAELAEERSDAAKKARERADLADVLNED